MYGIHINIISFLRYKKETLLQQSLFLYHICTEYELFNDQYRASGVTSYIATYATHE